MHDYQVNWDALIQALIPLIGAIVLYVQARTLKIQGEKNEKKIDANTAITAKTAEAAGVPQDEIHKTITIPPEKKE